MLVFASLVLGFATLDALSEFVVVRLHSLFGCNHLGCIAMVPVASCIPFPFSTSCDAMLTMLVYATCWLSLHLYMLAYMSMHGSCLLVCRPCFNTMKLWTFDPNLHLSFANTTFVCFLACLPSTTCWLSLHLYMLAYMSMHGSCLLVCRPCFNTMKLWTFDPNLHLSLADTTFVCFLACLRSCLFACFLSSLLAMFIVLIYFMPLSYALCIFSIHCLFAGFLSFPLHVHTWSEDA